MTRALVAAVVVAVVLAALSLWRAVVDTHRRRSVLIRMAQQPNRSGTARTSAAARGGRSAWIAGIAAAAGLLVGGPVLAVISVLGVAAGARLVERQRARSLPMRHADALADIVDGLARTIRGGAPVVTAVRAAAVDAPQAVGDGLVALASLVDRGVPIVDAVDDWAESSAIDGARLVATSFAVTSAAGGDHGRALAAVADTLRERRALRRELAALSSQARLSAAVIAVAPLGFAVVAASLDAAVADVLLGTPLGVACVTLGVVLDVAGWQWMDRITRSVA